MLQYNIKAILYEGVCAYSVPCDFWRLIKLLAQLVRHVHKLKDVIKPINLFTHRIRCVVYGRPNVIIHGIIGLRLWRLAMLRNPWLHTLEASGQGTYRCILRYVLIHIRRLLWLDSLGATTCIWIRLGSGRCVTPSRLRRAIRNTMEMLVESLLRSVSCFCVLWYLACLYSQFPLTGTHQSLLQISEGRGACTRPEVSSTRENLQDFDTSFRFPRHIKLFITWLQFWAYLCATWTE